MSFEVRELTAEILEAGIIVQGCLQGSKLRVAYRVGHFQKGGKIEKKTRYCGHMFWAGLRTALKAYFSWKKGKFFEIGFQISLTRCWKGLGTKCWGILKRSWNETLHSRKIPFLTQISKKSLNKGLKGPEIILSFSFLIFYVFFLYQSDPEIWCFMNPGYYKDVLHFQIPKFGPEVMNIKNKELFRP